MAKISTHFSRYEFQCHCGCGRAGIDIDLVRILEKVRKWAGDVVHVTSGFRCEDHNRKVGGARLSFHVTGRAADIKVAGKTPKQVYDFLNSKYPNRLGLGLYKTWVHVDSDENRRRW